MALHVIDLHISQWELFILPWVYSV